MRTVVAEVNSWMATEFVWGQSDCVIVLADWVKKVKGVDLADDLRNAYSCRATCQRLTGFFTDPVKFMGDRLERVGAVKTETPQTGDVAVIVVTEEDGRVGPVGALWVDKVWVVKGRKGVVTIRPELVMETLAAWSLGHEEKD